MRGNCTKAVFFAMIIALVVSPCAVGQGEAQQQPKDQNKSAQGPSIQGPKDQAAKDGAASTGNANTGTAKIAAPVQPQDIVFTPRDQQLIRQWFLMSGTDVTLGLSKLGDHLPPGIEQQLKRNRILPFNLQKRIDGFPMGLARQMSALPKDYSRAVIGVYALILDRNKRVMDVMRFR